jgi:hypothetical protein
MVFLGCDAASYVAGTAHLDQRCPGDCLRYQPRAGERARAGFSLSRTGADSPYEWQTDHCSIFCRDSWPPTVLPDAASNYRSAKTYFAAVFPDFVTYVLPPGYTNVPSRRAKAGDTIIFIGTGFGPVSPAVPPGTVATGPSKLVASVRIYFAGFGTGSIPGQVTYAGVIAGTAGLYQINVVGLAAGTFLD